MGGRKRGPLRGAAAAGGGPSDGRPRRRSPKRSWFHGLAHGLPAAIAVGSAASGCLLFQGDPDLQVFTAPPPSAEERYCAWYGDARDGIAYFGESPFWWAYRRQGGDPRADLAIPGPQLVGRFDLRRRALLPHLDLAPPASAGGIWDVLAHPNGRVYFTDFFGASGYVEPETGRVARFEALGAGLNEIALGPEGQLLVTRYGSDRSEDGSVLVLDPEGALLAEHVIRGPEGWRVAPKSVAWDPVRREIWLNTDLLPAGTGIALGSQVRHDARVLGADGVERLRFDTPEVQFFTFSEDGTGWFAEVDSSYLSLRIRPPERAASPVLLGRVVPLDDAFSRESDFVQDLHVDGDTAVVTRWSGRVHLVDEDGRATSLSLPTGSGSELYYSGFRAGRYVCATRCGGVEIVCRAVPR